MVAIVSGESLGLSLTSFTTLGQDGAEGPAGTGRSGEQAFVNIATGNLVLEDQDDFLAARGSDISSIRTYDAAGRITAAIDPDGQAVAYAYDAAGRLTDTYRDGVNVEARKYDAQGHILETSAAAIDGVADSTLAELGLSAERRASHYDQAGQIAGQSVFDKGGVHTSDMSYRYDGAARLAWHQLNVRVGAAYANRYEYSYLDFDTSQVEKVSGYRMLVGDTKGDLLGSTVNSYDANGYLIKVDGIGASNADNTRTLVNDAQGRVLRKTQRDHDVATKYHVTTTLIANGQVIGSSSDDKAADTSTFRSNYVPVNDASLTSGPTAYTVRQGETLQTIAQAVWGNANLWYLIADANGISSVAEGNVISIPAKPNTLYSDAQTFKPYSASEAVGDTTPILPVPQANGGGCGGLGQLIMIVVAVAVSFYLGPQMLELVAGPGIGVAEASVGQLMVAGAMTGAVASTASQAVGIAIGAQEGFSWKGVALGALGGAIGGGMLKWNPMNDIAGNMAARAAVGNALSQGIGVVTGLQDHFDWRGVAASAVGAGVGQAVSGPLGEAFGNVFKDSPNAAMFATRLTTGLAAGAAAAVMRGGRVAIQQVATDAFGNTLGQGLVDAMSNPNQPTTSATQRFTPEDIDNRSQSALDMLATAADAHGGYDRIPLTSPALRLASSTALANNSAIRELMADGVIAGDLAIDVNLAATGSSASDVMSSVVQGGKRNAAIGLGVVAGMFQQVGDTLIAGGGLVKDLLLAQQYLAVGGDNSLNRWMPGFDERQQGWNSVLDLSKTALQIASDPKRFLGDTIGRSVDTLDTALKNAQRNNGLDDWFFYGAEVGKVTVGVASTIAGAAGAARLATLGTRELTAAMRSRIDSLGPDIRINPFLPELSQGSPVRAGASTKIRWVDENAGMSDEARQYNDSASGARSNTATQSGQAPAIYRTTGDGSGRLVKFDGVDGEVLIDRKMSVLTTEKAKAQAIRQSEALAENDLTARWEVPTIQQATRAQKMFSQLGIKNISVKVVVPWPSR